MLVQRSTGGRSAAGSSATVSPASIFIGRRGSGWATPQGRALGRPSARDLRRRRRRPRHQMACAPSATAAGEDQPCLVMGGAQGIGKDTMLEPVKHAVGPWNFHEVSPAHLLGRFNSLAKSVILARERSPRPAVRASTASTSTTTRKSTRPLRPTCCGWTKSTCANTMSSTASAS